ncbi:hypothetical protein BKA82DRAFT_1003551, partial [Pisolithus tinctorius]
VATAQGYQSRVFCSTTGTCLWEDPSARNVDLSSYLLVPMQCLTRYPLLIRQVQQYNTHAELEPIGYALAYAEHILAEVNETIRDRENRAGFVVLSFRFRFTILLPENSSKKAHRRKQSQSVCYGYYGAIFSYFSTRAAVEGYTAW